MSMPDFESTIFGNPAFDEQGTYEDSLDPATGLHGLSGPGSGPNGSSPA